jgi:predicted ATPase
MQEGPLQRYRQMVLARELSPDTAQELAAEKLQLLANRLGQYSVPRLGDLAAADPIASAAAEIGADAALLCFDEREVTDIADAPTNRGLT